MPMGETANRSKQRADGRRLSGRSTAMRTLLGRIEKIAPTRASVMIAGESGSARISSRAGCTISVPGATARSSP